MINTRHNFYRGIFRWKNDAHGDGKEDHKVSKYTQPADRLRKG